MHLVILVVKFIFGSTYETIKNALARPVHRFNMGSSPSVVRIMYGSSWFQTMSRSIAAPMQYLVGSGF